MPSEYGTPESHATAGTEMIVGTKTAVSAPD